MESRTELTCIRCPIGCQITVTQNEKGEVTEIQGNSCPNGYRYASEEVTAPVRTLTSTVRVRGGELPVVPVRTRGDIPKGRMFDCMKELARVCAEAPVRAGDVMIADILGLGVDVVATRNVAAASAAESGL